MSLTIHSQTVSWGKIDYVKPEMCCSTVAF